MMLRAEHGGKFLLVWVDKLLAIYYSHLHDNDD